MILQAETYTCPKLVAGTFVSDGSFQPPEAVVTTRELRQVVGSLQLGGVWAENLLGLAARAENAAGDSVEPGKEPVKLESQDALFMSQYAALAGLAITTVSELPSTVNMTVELIENPKEFSDSDYVQARNTRSREVRRGARAARQLEKTRHYVAITAGRIASKIVRPRT